MMDSDNKISAGFRERLAELQGGETIFALVTLAMPAREIPSNRAATSRRRILADIETATEEPLRMLTELVEDAGGQVLSVSKPLSIVTVQADRQLVERLAESDFVSSIMENQAIDSIDTLRDK